jgi:aromatase
VPRIQHSIQIDRAPVDVFAVTNDIDNWRVLFNEYHHSEVVAREEAGRFTRLVFRLTNKDGMSWQSWRILDHQELTAIAAREDPLYPFRFMHLTWTYRPADGGTAMTWTQDFELDPAFDGDPVKVAGWMEAHGRENQQRIKKLIESGEVDHLIPTVAA